jgi:hypothetical protein
LEDEHKPSEERSGVMVLSDLAAICQKLSENSIVPKMLRDRASEFVEEFHSLVPYSGKGDAKVHFQAENLLIKIARFLARMVELQTWPADSSNLDDDLNPML